MSRSNTIRSFKNKVSLITHSILQSSTPSPEGNPFRMARSEKLRLGKLYINTLTTTTILGKEIEFTDPYRYLHKHEELLINEIYLFKARNDTPYIVDCGANFGISI